MTTITGILENAAGEVLHARIDFISRSTPLVGAGVITANTDKSLKTNPLTGEFSIQLQAGNYHVEINAQGLNTQFDIAVPDGDDTLSIEEVVSTPLAYTFIAPNTVWNGVRAGAITFDPISDPPAPTTSPFAVSPGIGHQTGEAASYKVVWIDQDNNHSAPSEAVANTPPVSPNNATRVFLPTAPTRVTNAHLYRLAADGNFYLHTTVSALIGTIDDGLSNAQWESFLNVNQAAPSYNTTAGGLLGKIGGEPLAYVTDGALQFPDSNLRIKQTKGIQIYNFDTGLWHTLLCTGSAPSIAFDDGEI